METNKKNIIIKEAVDTLLSMYRSGKLSQSVAWSIIRKRKDDTGIPADKWSIGNQLLMLMQGTTDARGFKQWQSVGRQVQKGSKAIHILAPISYKVKQKNKITGKEEEKVIIKGFTPISVFRVEDTDGIPLQQYDYAPEQYPPFFDAAEKLGIKVQYQPVVANWLGKFTVNTNTIHLAAHDCEVYYHELAHAVHSTFVDLKVLDNETAEITAEFAALVMCRLNGIEDYNEQGFKYISRFGKADYDKPETVITKIFRVLNDVEKIVNIVLDNSSAPIKGNAPLEAAS